jgi:hypothetical protein
MINKYVYARNSSKSMITLNKNGSGPVFFIQVKCLRYIHYLIFMPPYFIWVSTLSNQLLISAMLDKKTLLFYTETHQIQTALR